MASAWLKQGFDVDRIQGLKDAGLNFGRDVLEISLLLLPPEKTCALLHGVPAVEPQNTDFTVAVQTRIQRVLQRD